MSAMTRFAADESGATAIEYGLIAALISVAAIGALEAIGGSLSDVFNKIDSDLDVGGGTGGTN